MNFTRPIRCLLFALLLAAPCSVRAVDLITATLAVTNNPTGNTNTFTVAGSVRTFTNNVTASPGTLVQQTNTVSLTATQILNHLTGYPALPGHLLKQSSASNVVIRGLVGENLTVSVSVGWGLVTYSTQTVSSPTFVVRMPITVEAATNQTNIASALGAALNFSTNAIGTNWTAGSNYLTRGAHAGQVVASPVQFGGRTAVRSGFFATNGFTSALTNINPVTSNLVNYGNAIRSEGSGGNSFQAGSNAVASGELALALGNSSSATNTSSLAVGVGAFAGGNSSIAIGPTSEVLSNGAITIGFGSKANGESAISIGTGVGAVGSGDQTISIGEDSGATSFGGIALGEAASSAARFATAIGYQATANHSNAVALGRSATSTTTNQVRLGTSAETVSIPGVLAIDGTQTNTTFRGTNVINGRLDFKPSVNTALANGYNSGVVLGTNVYLRLSGHSTAVTNAGWAAEQDGSYHVLQFDNPAINLTILNASGVDATPANRILTGTGADLNLTNNPVIVSVIYDANTARWRLISWTR